MFIERNLTSIIESGIKQVPIIAIIGPRQSGKSTLIKKIFKDYTYLDMQDAEIFEFANNDPKGFLNYYKNEVGLIIDEAQYAPKLFSQLKVEVDKNPRPGYYILSGSQNFLLHEKISESLAGRVYFYKLLPLSIKELKTANLLCDNATDQIYKGFYPRVFQPQVNAQEYYENYILTYVERDIRSIRNIENILVFKKFMQICALRIGTTLNFSDLSANCGISIDTARKWLALLETSFILFLLPSYHDNLGKRITKSPKLYFYDVGLATALMGLEKEIFVQKRVLYGALFENMVIVDIIKNFNSQGLRYNLSFFRDINKNEIDLIIETGGKTIPVEIKSSQTMNSSFFETLDWFKKEMQNNQESVVVYGGNQNQKWSLGQVVSWQNLEKIFKIKNFDAYN
ncbi:ATP-binding protein [Candidatus Babeliales bacterium]|nr:ATP-binding protein [Candidatus Babeliales bacterium]MCF7899562.1 ATP-binding protein [Candidatus Babeliales bacterium]